MSDQTAQLQAAHCLPDADGLVLAAGVEDLTIRRESEGRDPALVTDQAEQLVSRACVPKPDGSIMSARGDDVAVRRKGHTLDTAFVSFEAPQRRSRADAPEPDRRVLTGCRQREIVGGECQRRDPARVAGNLSLILARGQ